MIKIEFNSQWKRFYKLYGTDIRARYNWFLNHFGQEAAKLFQRKFLENVKGIAGDVEYKKRIMLAEVRDRNKLWWSAVVFSAKAEDGHDADTTLFTVHPRFQNDAVIEILEKYGPWTIETIPFAPSLRQAVVVTSRVEPERVKIVAAKNRSQAALINADMDRLGVSFEQRRDVYSKLMVVRDLAIDAVAWEFGVQDGGKPHWRPTIRWMRRAGVRNLSRRRRIHEVFWNPNFRRYRRRRRLGLRLTVAEVKKIAAFQKKVNVR